jgi:hypothetical protein
MRARHGWPLGAALPTMLGALALRTMLLSAAVQAARNRLQHDPRN